MKSIFRHAFGLSLRRAAGLAGLFLGGLGSWAEADTFTVTTTADSGLGSLRAAMESANITAGPHEIRFTISGGAPFTITPLSALERAVVIDGTVQPGFAGTPVVVLDGSLAGSGASGLLISAGGSTVRGLVIQRFSFAGLWLTAGSGHFVEGNYLGLSANGTQAPGNGSTALLVGCGGNRIGGTTAGARNVISGNGWSGVYLYNSSAANNVLEGNFVGTDASGQAALGNRDRGIVILDSAGNRVGGTAAGAGNLISGNLQSGLALDGRTSGTLVQGNLLGTKADGVGALSNGYDGLEIRAAHHNVIGGTAPGAGNVLSGNAVSGLSILGSTAIGNVVAGNLIGTQADGVGALGNRQYGVLVYSAASNNAIGGLAAGAGNVIAHNCVASAADFDGVRIHYTAGIVNRVSGNSIFANHGGLEIDVGTNGLTLNSLVNTNPYPNFPVLKCAPLRAGRAVIYGEVSA